MQAALMGPVVEAEGVVGHWASWRSEPAKPPVEKRLVSGYQGRVGLLEMDLPTRAWTSHIPEKVPEEARFHSMRMAPACVPCVLTIMSDHSTYPGITGIAYSHHRLGTALVVEEGAAGHDYGVALAHELGVGGNG